MDTEKSLVAWVCAMQLNCNGLSKKCKSLMDLVDLRLIYELLSQMYGLRSSPHHFHPSNIISDSDNRIMSLLNYRTLFHSIEDYYLDNFSTPIELICSELSLQDLAFSPSSAKLLPLMELVVAVTVQCKNKQAYISKMCVLPEGVQSQLMFFIQRVLEKSNDSGNDPDRALRAIRREKRLLRLDFDTIKNELISFYRRSEDSTPDPRPKSPVPDPARRRSSRISTEFEAVIRAEYETQITVKNDQIAELKRQIAKLEESTASEIGRLRDENDSAESEITNLQALVDHFKKKLSDFSHLESELTETKRNLEDSLQKTIKFDELSKNFALLQHNLSITKDQLQAERETVLRLQETLSEKADLMRELSKTEMELREKNGILKGNNAELKKEVEGMRRDTGRKGDRRERDLGSELEEKVQRLMDENAALRASSGEALLIEHYSKELDSALLDKQRVEAQCRLLQQQVLDLEKDKNDLQSQIKEEHEKHSLSLEEKSKKKNEFEAMEIHLKAEIREISLQNAAILKEKQEIERINDELAATCLEKTTRIRSLEGDIGVLSTIIKEKNEITTAAETEKLLASPENAQSHLQKLKILELERGLSDKARELAVLTATLSDRDETIATLKDQQEEWMRRFVQNAETAKGKIRTEYENRVKEGERREETLEKTVESWKGKYEGLVQEWRREERLLAMVIQNLGAEIRHLQRKQRI